MTASIMHVTTIPQTLHFFRGQIGYLKGRGFDVTVVSSPGTFLDRFAATEQIQSVGVPMERRFAPSADLLSTARLIRAVLRVRPQIIHSHTPKAGLLGTFAAR